MYYLQSRYYDPQIGRFINADVYASTGQGVVGFNMFAYCINTPVDRVDSNGEKSSTSIVQRGSDGYHITTIYERWKNVTCSYLITYEGCIRFDFKTNPYGKVVLYGFTRMLASTMYRLAKKLDSNFLIGRTETGILRELRAHHVASCVGFKPKNANPADIGALYPWCKGYDSNAYLFE